MNIYVGNLSFNVTQEQLKEAFESHGSVDKVAIINDRETGRSKGFAFVEMPNDAEAKAAITGMNGKDLGGRAINVNEARPKEDRPRERRF